MHKELYRIHGEIADLLTWKQYQRWTGELCKWPCTYEQRMLAALDVSQSLKVRILVGEALIRLGDK
jgi:N-acetylmuramoyl-L-alanine amidase CwlA